jgi:hypothetical protein
VGSRAEDGESDDTEGMKDRCSMDKCILLIFILLLLDRVLDYIYYCYYMTCGIEKRGRLRFSMRASLGVSGLRSGDFHELAR